MANSTSSPWQPNQSTVLLSTETLEGTDLNAEYDGYGLGEWPHFSISGHAYWASILIVVLLGLVGNALATCLMTESRFSSFSYPVYLIWLVASDSTLLVIKMVEETQQTFSLHYFVNDSTVICKIWLYLRYITFLLSPWLVVGLTMDRFICVMFPLSRNRFCTRRKAVIVCSVLTLFSALVLLPFLIDVKLIEGQCSGPHALYYLHIVVRLLLSSTFPCFLILVFNIAIITRIQRSATFRKSFTSSNTSSTTNKQDKSTRPLVLVSIFAFITLLPLSVTECVEVLLNITKIDTMATILAMKLWPLFNIIYLMNFGQNFYILMASSSNYRKIMAMKMPCKKSETRLSNLGGMAPISNMMSQPRVTSKSKDRPESPVTSHSNATIPEKDVIINYIKGQI